MVSHQSGAQLKRFVLDLHRDGIQLYAEQGKLKTRAAAGAITPQIGAEIRANKDALLALLSEVAANDAAPAPLPRRPAGAELPLSFAQQRLWFIDQLEGGSSQYHLPAALRLEGELDVAALHSALHQLLQRHEVLRTTYASVAGGAVQRPGAAAPLVLAVHDLAALEPLQREEAVHRHARQHTVQPFDLAREPMLRASLLVLGPDSHVLLVTLHHIAADGWTLGLVVREFAQLYAAQRTGQPSPLAPLPLQYADFAHWQRSYLEGARLQEQLAYWRARLEGLPLVHGLPLDRPRPARQQFTAGLHQQCLPAALLARLKALGGQHHATLFMVLHTALAVLLARWSGERDIVIGSPIAGRNRPELEGMAGMFVNSLVLRNDIDPDAPFAQLLEQDRRDLLDAYAHQELPFEQLVEALQPERSLAHAPLCQVMFSMQNLGQGSLQLPGLQVAPLAGGPAVTRYELELSAAESPQGLVLDWNFAAALFDAATIERMAASFAVLLEAIAATPQQAVGRLPVLGRQDLAVLQSWQEAGQAAALALPPARCLHQLFEEQSAATPDAVALRSDAGNWSYRQLNQEANRIAHCLLATGVAMEAPVGLCAGRSPAMVAALLGILKAGAAYVPLDPAYPAERIAFLARDSGMQLLLSGGALPEGLQAVQQDGLRVLVLDAILAEGWPAHDPALPVQPSQLANVIYTSGSTGQPKGTLLEHAGALRLLAAGSLPYGAGSVSLHLSSISFDAATFELWAPLCQGGSVALYPPAPIDMEELNRQVLRHGVTTLFLTSGLFEQWSARLPQLPTLRHVMSGGDVVSTSGVARLQQALPAVQYINLYGPTENSSLSTSYPVPAGWPAGQPLPLGHALPGTLLRVCDGLGQEVPPGVAGELWLGGSGVARGYRQRPQQNAHAFVSLDGARWYRSGDRVRRRLDGILEFIGRNDGQVKLRGFRIEPEEIEARLMALDGVAEASVQVQGEGMHKQLVAYVAGAVAGEQAAALAARLRAGLGRDLPEYMLPSAFVALAALPLTPNGKLDRAALRRIELPRAAQQGMPPATPMQRKLAGAWCDLLKLGSVGIDDSFFSLGGNSITLIELKFRLQELGLRVELKDLMEQATIRALAAWLEAQAAGGAVRDLAADTLVRLNQGGSGLPLYVLHPFGGGVEGYRALAQSLAGVAPVTGVQAPCMAGADFHFDTLEQLARLYADAILAEAPGQPCALAGYSGGGKLATLVAALLQREGRAVRYLALFDCNFHDPDYTPDEDDFVRLSRFCFSLHVINSAAEVPAAWRGLPYADLLERFTDLVLERRNYERQAVQATLKFGVNLLRAGWTPPQGLALDGPVHAFLSTGNGAPEQNRACWSAVFANPPAFHPVDADHNQFMETASLQQMQAALVQALNNQT